MQHTNRLSTFRMLGFCTILLLSACQEKSERSFAKQSPAPPPPSDIQAEAASEQAPSASKPAPPFEEAAISGSIFSSSAAAPGPIDSLKQFVRNAEINFRVKNTAASTLQVEDIVVRNGGFVVRSNLNTQVELQHSTPVSRDSALETTRYSVHSQLVVRVPYRLLDTTLRSIGRLSDFLNYRHVSAEDVGLQMLEQALARLREGVYRSDLEGAEENKMMPKADRARDSRAASDQARIETLKLEDAIRFSTITVDLYQLPQIRQTMVANTTIAAPEAPISMRITEAFNTGASIITLLFLGLIQLWGLILLVLLAFLVWKRLRKPKSLPVVQPQKS